MTVKKSGGLINGPRGEVTSKRMASIAGKTLGSKRSSALDKKLAGGLLTQVPRGGYAAKKK